MEVARTLVMAIAANPPVPVHATVKAHRRSPKRYAKTGAFEAALHGGI